MTMAFSYEKARRSFDLVFQKAAVDGKVTIKKNKENYTLLSDSPASPFDVKGVNLKISSAEIVDFIHESRKF